MKNRMNILGIGTYLAVALILYIMMVIYLTSVVPQAFHFAYVPGLIRIILGVLFSVFGLLFLIASLRVFIKRFAAGKLVKEGPFAFCRNPIYASWIWFIIPGIAFLADSWPILGASLLMYIMFKLNICKEEQALSDAFGDEYLAYKRSVNELLPLPRKRPNFIK